MDFLGPSRPRKDPERAYVEVDSTSNVDIRGGLLAVNELPSEEEAERRHGLAPAKPFIY